MFVYFWEREGEREKKMWAGEGQRERGQRIQSRLPADSTEPHVGLELMNHEIMTWVEIDCFTNWATKAPLDLSDFNPLEILSRNWIWPIFKQDHYSCHAENRLKWDNAVSQAKDEPGWQQWRHGKSSDSGHILKVEASGSFCIRFDVGDKRKRRTRTNLKF